MEFEVYRKYNLVNPSEITIMKGVLFVVNMCMVNYQMPLGS